ARSIVPSSCTRPTLLAWTTRSLWLPSKPTARLTSSILSRSCEKPKLVSSRCATLPCSPAGGGPWPSVWTRWDSEVHRDGGTGRRGTGRRGDGETRRRGEGTRGHGEAKVHEC